MHCLVFGGPSCRLDLGRILGEVEVEVGRLGLAGVGQPSLGENLAWHWAELELETILQTDFA